VPEFPVLGSSIGTGSLQKEEKGIWMTSKKGKEGRTPSENDIRE
jgi:hypothetical protein